MVTGHYLQSRLHPILKQPSLNYTLGNTNLYLRPDYTIVATDIHTKKMQHFISALSGDK